MPRADLDTVFRLIADVPNQTFFVGPRSAELIASAEQALGGALPPQYRTFVEKLGAGNIRAVEVYGVISEPFDGPVPDAVWLTLEERRTGNISADLVIVGDNGDGGYYCIRQGEDGPVILIGGAGREEVAAADFGAYLAMRLA